MPQPLSSLYNSQIVRLLYRGLFTVSFATVHKKKEESYLPSSMHGIRVSRNTYPTQLSNRPLPIFWKAIYYTNIAAASRFVEGLFPHGAKPGCHQHCRRASTPCRFRLCRARRRLDGDRRREGGGTRWQPLASSSPAGCLCFPRRQKLPWRYCHLCSVQAASAKAFCILLRDEKKFER